MTLGAIKNDSLMYRFGEAVANSSKDLECISILHLLPILISIPIILLSITGLSVKTGIR